MCTSSGARADDVDLEELIARSNRAYVSLSRTLKENGQARAALTTALTQLEKTTLLFDSYDKESDELTLTLVTKSGELKLEFKRIELLAALAAEKTLENNQKADCLQGQICRLPCQLEAAIKSYRIGKLLSFLTGLGAGAAIGGGGGGGGAIASVSVW
ncbi:MAG: hypothetical protein O2904_04225 [bacterium]|nr:hypothetical protein [bacterium]